MAAGGTRPVGVAVGVVAAVGAGVLETGGALPVGVAMFRGADALAAGTDWTLEAGGTFPVVATTGEA